MRIPAAMLNTPPQAMKFVSMASLIMGIRTFAKKKKQVFAALRAKCPAAIRWAITDEVLDAGFVIDEDSPESILDVFGDTEESDTDSYED